MDALAEQAPDPNLARLVPAASLAVGTEGHPAVQAFFQRVAGDDGIAFEMFDVGFAATVDFPKCELIEAHAGKPATVGAEGDLCGRVDTSWNATRRIRWARNIPEKESRHPEPPQPIVDRPG